MYICIYTKYMLFISQGSIANHWGNIKEIKITCPKELQEYRIQLLILAPDSCSDSNWMQSKASRIGFLSFIGGLCKTQTLLWVYLHCSFQFRERIQLHEGGAFQTVLTSRSQVGNLHSLILWLGHMTTSHLLLISKMLITTAFLWTWSWYSNEIKSI